ncbi:hypothetical protein SDC9_136918 [bioreactor metagenome]|uniref:Uncharacterized protein n=1 Tax=bioreactor metagenome TaxID=1076179 RepID=A0A645DLZ3_9ZZZZ
MTYSHANTKWIILLSTPRKDLSTHTPCQQRHGFGWLVHQRCLNSKRPFRRHFQQLRRGNPFGDIFFYRSHRRYRILPTFRFSVLFCRKVCNTADTALNDQFAILVADHNTRRGFHPIRPGTLSCFFLHTTDFGIKLVSFITGTVKRTKFLFQFIQTRLFFIGIDGFWFFQQQVVLPVLTITTYRFWTTHTPRPALAQFVLQCNRVQFFLYKALNQYAVSRSSPLFLGKQIFTNHTASGFICFTTHKEKG